MLRGPAGKPPIRWPVRVLLLVAFTGYTLPVLPFVAGFVKILQPVIALDLFVRAVPLFLTAGIDHLFFDGGEVTPHFIPLWVLLTGLMLWPLLALAMFPALWLSRRFRKGLALYGLIALAATTGAACWVFTHLGTFF